MYHAAKSNWSALSASCLQEAGRNLSEAGYAVIPGALAPGSCDAVLADVREAFDQAEPAFGKTRMGGLLHGHLNCFPGVAAKGLADELEASGVVRLMEEVFGAPLVLASAGCNINMPGSRAQNFHIDGEWDSPFMIVNVSLVDTDVNNGSMQIAPGTDKTRLAYWRFLAKGLKSKSLRPASRSGDILIRSSTLWHRGMPNRSDSMRPMIGFVYLPAGAATSAVDFHADGGAVTFASNRYGAGLAGLASEMVATYAEPLATTLRVAKSLVKG